MSAEVPKTDPPVPRFVIVHRLRCWYVLRHYGYFQGVPIYLGQGDACRDLDTARDRLEAAALEDME